MGNRARRTTVVALSSALALAALAGPAAADGRSGGSDGGGGYNASAHSVTVTLSGDTAPGVASVSAPALCWWEPIPVSTGGMTAITLLETIGTLGIGGIDLGAVLDVIKAEKKSGEAFGWYIRKKSPDATDAQLEAAGCNNPSGPFQGLFVGNLVRPFAPGQEPEPLPDPKKMAEAAMEHLGIEPAELDHNPKITSIDQGTLVNLPTWFWADNPAESVGDAQGERQVTATAGPVSVTVVAKAGDLHLTSPAGSTTCTVQQARTAYAAGTPDSSACVLSFERASNAYAEGFPVRASVLWSASWTGTGPGTDGAVHQLDDLPQASTTTVAVRESQAVVDRVG